LLAWYIKRVPNKTEMELTKITTRIPKALKRKLIAEAKRQNISLQELITNKSKMNLKVKAHKTNKWAYPVEVKRGNLSQKARLREQGIWSWEMMLLAAKGI
jgi:hypothetical protein